MKSVRQDQLAGRGKLGGLDGLRGIAALVVLAHHGLHRAGVEWFAQGYLAVDLFFMLSGFVVALAYEGQFQAGLGFAEFAKVRLIRLYPLIALGVILGGFEAMLGISSVAGWKGAFFAQLALIPSLWLAGAPFPLNGVQWSLFFEYGINIFHALIERWLSTTRVAILVAVGALALSATSWHYGSLWVGWDRHTFLGGFARVGFSYFAGVGIYRLHGVHRLPNIRAHWTIQTTAIPLTIVTAHLVHRPQITDLIIVLIIFPVIVIAGLQVKLSERPLRAATWLGSVSYPAYALQIPIAMLAKQVPLPNSTFLQVAYWMVISVFTLITASFTLHYFDEPVRLWLRRKTLVPKLGKALGTAP